MNNYTPIELEMSEKLRFKKKDKKKENLRVTGGHSSRHVRYVEALGKKEKSPKKFFTPS